MLKQVRIVRGTNDGVLYCGLVLGYLEYVKHVLKYFKMNENVLTHFNREDVAERVIFFLFFIITLTTRLEILMNLRELSHRYM